MRCLVAIYLCSYPLLANEQVISSGLARVQPGLYDAIQKAYDLDGDAAKGFCLSLGIMPIAVNVEVVLENQQFLNSLATICPTGRIIPSFGQHYRLDDIYDTILTGMLLPEREFSPEYTKAMNLLVSDHNKPTEIYEKYRVYRDKFINAETIALTSNSKIDEAKADDAKLAWSTLGNRSAVDSAINEIHKTEESIGASRQLSRRQSLDASRSTPIGIPVSSFFPKPSRWAEDAGWVEIAYPPDKDFSRSLKDVSYTIEIKRIAIERPWLDISVFFGANWTWKKTSGNGISEYPFVAVPPSEGDGTPNNSPTPLYNGKEISLPLFPADMIIARRASFSASIKNEEYAKLVEEVKSSGAILFGSIVVPSPDTLNLRKLAENGEYTTFRLESNDTGVVLILGFISKVLHRLPDPNILDTWGPDAWLPSTK